MLAWSLVERGWWDKVAVSAAFGAVYAAHALIQRVTAARTEAEVLERAAAGVLHGDVLRPSVLPDQDAHIEVAHGVNRAASLLAQTLPNLVGDGIASAGIAVALARIEPARLVALAAAAIALGAAALALSRTFVAETVARSWARQEEVYEAFGNALEGRLEIVAAGARARFLGEFGDRTRAWSGGSAKAAAAEFVSGRLALAGVIGLVGAALLATGRLRASLSISLADAAVFASAVPVFLGVAQGLQLLARDAHWARLVARLVAPADARPSRPRAPVPVPPLPAPVAFEGVSFRYGAASRDATHGDNADATPALVGVSLAWSGREILGLSGANGSGKSTLLRLLLALGVPSEGVVRIGDVSLEALDPETWRGRTALLSQRPYLPPRVDIRRAVRWPASEASDARILGALDRVGLLPALQRRAQGRGGDPLAVGVDALSVGQRQRVALARLLCRDADLFLLDEPDANLDAAGIALVASLVRELGARGMVAFAAHTPELLRAADRVVALDAGRVLP